MPAVKSRFVAFWATAERRASIWFRIAAIQAVLLGLTLVTLGRVVARPREVIRIACDGIPQVVQINEAVYSEPAEQEIRAFAATFATFYARSDSYSVVNDLVFCMRRMTPELRERFKTIARGSRERPGIAAVVESLKRRTQVDPAALDVTVDKRTYPWRAVVKGSRQVVGEPPEAAQSFELELELVRTSRDELIEGLLVWGVRAKGDALDVGLTRP
jgi:hypothetical protein